MQALDRERQAALVAQQRAMERHLAELDAERQHQADLAAQLSETQVTPWLRTNMIICRPLCTLTGLFLAGSWHRLSPTLSILGHIPR